jgi:hypothetical protein
LCEFYLKNIRPEISEIERNVIRTKYDKLLNTDSEIIQSYIEKIAALAAK